MLEKEVSQVFKSLIQDITRLCGINSIRSNPEAHAPYGKGVRLCLDEAMKIAKDLGFRTEIWEDEVGIASIGPETEAYLACVGHLDVVEVEGQNWTSDPFVCTQRSGKLYARGVLDNKGPLLACLYAAKLVSEKELPIQIKVFFGTNEETGMQDMARYFQSHQPPVMGWTPDCKYPVVYAERGRLTCLVDAQLQHEAHLVDQLNIAYEDQEFGRLEIRSLQSVGQKTRLIISYPASVKAEQLVARLNEQYPTSLEANIDPVYYDKDSVMIKTLEEVYEEITGQDGRAVTTTGGTYAKVVPNIVPFGPSFPGQKGIGHLADEWLGLDDLLTNLRIYTEALWRLSQLFHD